MPGEFYLFNARNQLFWGVGHLCFPISSFVVHSNNITFESCITFVFVSIVWVSELLKDIERLQGPNAIKRGALGLTRCYSAVIMR
jgi:hypothetical protein